MSKCDTCAKNKPDCPARHTNPVKMCYDYQSSPVDNPQPTVLTDEERCLETCTNIGATCPSDSHYCPKCDEYMPDKATLDYGARQRITQDTYTRSALIAQGWKSPQEYRAALDLSEAQTKAVIDACEAKQKELDDTRQAHRAEMKKIADELDKWLHQEVWPEDGESFDTDKLARWVKEAVDFQADIRKKAGL